MRSGRLGDMGRGLEQGLRLLYSTGIQEMRAVGPLHFHEDIQDPCAVISGHPLEMPPWTPRAAVPIAQHRTIPSQTPPCPPQPLGP